MTALVDSPVRARFVPLEYGDVTGWFDPTNVVAARRPLDYVPAPHVLREAQHPAVRRLYINASQACNLRCTYCFADFGHRYDGPATMGRDVAEAGIRMAVANLDPDASDLRLVFFGGEPWLAVDLCLHLLDYARRETIRLGMDATLSALFVTNFTLPTRVQLARMAGLPIDISVSIDGDQQTHDRHRIFGSGKGSWEKVAENVRTLRDRVPGHLNAVTTVTAENLRLRETVEAVMELGFDQMCVRHVFCPDPRVNLEKKEVDQLIEAYTESARVNLDRVRRREPAEFELFRVHFEILRSRSQRRYPCGAGREWFTLTTGGRFYPCPEYSPHLPVGDVEKGFDREAVADFSARTGVRPDRVCATCRARPFCRGGCSAEAFRLQGTYDSVVTTRCELQRAIGDLAVGAYLELSELAPDVLDKYVGYGQHRLRAAVWPVSA